MLTTTIIYQALHCNFFIHTQIHLFYKFCHGDAESVFPCLNQGLAMTLVNWHKEGLEKRLCIGLTLLLLGIFSQPCEQSQVSCLKDGRPCVISTLQMKTLAWGTSLVAQWLRIHLPMQGTRVRALVWEDPTCRGATKPVRHNYWACTLEPASHNYWARLPQLLKPTCLEPVLCNKRSHHNEKPAYRNQE